MINYYLTNESWLGRHPYRQALILNSIQRQITTRSFTKCSQIDDTLHAEWSCGGVSDDLVFDEQGIAEYAARDSVRSVATSDNDRRVVCQSGLSAADRFIAVAGIVRSRQAVKLPEPYQVSGDNLVSATSCAALITSIIGLVGLPLDTSIRRWSIGLPAVNSRSS